MKPMKEKPIILSGPEVRAILEGRKTQTRRILKVQPIGTDAMIENGKLPGTFWAGKDCRAKTPAALEGYATNFKAYSNINTNQTWESPYTVGMRLWVRETWARVNEGSPDQEIVWAADRCASFYNDNGLVGAPYFVRSTFKPAKWKPSIFMPRKASRLTLEVTQVRVQRLQEISEEDAMEEGVQYHVAPSKVPGMVTPLFPISDPIRMKHYPNFTKEKITHEKMIRAEFASVWETINGPDSWSANPWVWVYHFRRIV